MASLNIAARFRVAEQITSCTTGGLFWRLTSSHHSHKKTGPRKVHERVVTHELPLAVSPSSHRCDLQQLIQRL
jgi:hypothetical protein